MNALSWLNSGVVWVEVTPRTLHVVDDGRAKVWPLERGAAGGLTEGCRTTVTSELTAFLARKPWQPRAEARCLVPAGGVTLRRWKVPRSGNDETRRVLALQIESELPLSPDELAWGLVKVGETGALQDVLVAAVRKTWVAEISTLLESCGVAPGFTVAALARAGCVVPRSSGGAGEAWLDLGPDQAEWLAMDAVGPVRLRVLPWGESTLVQEWMAASGATSEMAERWLGQALAGQGPGDPASDAATRSAWTAAVKSLAALIPGPVPGGRIQVTGRLAGVASFRTLLAEHLGQGIRVESGEPGGDRAVPAGIRRLRDETKGRAGQAGLWLTTKVEEAPTVLNQATPRKWAIAAGVLLLGLLLMPYLEAMLFYPGLASRVAAVKARQDRLQMIDRQADFLRHLKQNQTPYMETLLVLGKTLPPGSKMESLNLNRKGEMALRVSMRQPPEVTAFRSKLSESGFFQSVVIEEQSPTPDRQKIQVRISGLVKPANLRQGLPILAAGDGADAKPGEPRPGGVPGRPSREGVPTPGARGPVPKT